MDTITAQRYPFEVVPVPEEDGGGWMVTFPDLPGCIGAGDTREEAVAMGQDAALSWLSTAEEAGEPIPEPGAGSGHIALRVPKSLHARLKARAQREGVSLNTLLVSIISEGMGAPRKGNRRVA